MRKRGHGGQLKIFGLVARRGKTMNERTSALSDFASDGFGSSDGGAILAVSERFAPSAGLELSLGVEAEG